MPDWSTWSPYLQIAGAAIAGYVVKTVRDVEKEQIEIRTILKYYVERQTSDAAVRLDKANPAPDAIRALVKKHITDGPLTLIENNELTTWLRETGTGKNPHADSAERSAALQLLTGIRMREMLDKPKRKRWWLWV